MKASNSTSIVRCRTGVSNNGQCNAGRPESLHDRDTDVAGYNYARAVLSSSQTILKI
jgi:hypothetical protein